MLWCYLTCEILNVSKLSGAILRCCNIFRKIPYKVKNIGMAAKYQGCLEDQEQNCFMALSFNIGE